MAKWGRTYLLKAETSDNKIVEVEMPFSMEFNIMRSINGSANTANFTIYNLAPTTRKQIFKDPFVLEYRSIQLFAGYDDGESTLLPMLFNGHIKQAQSYREGVDFRTEIEAFDGAMAMTEGNASISQKSGGNLKDMMLGMMKGLPGVGGATVGGGYDQDLQRGQTVFGNPVEYLKTATKNRFFIDKNHAYVLADEEVLKGDIETIDASTGLIGTPRKSKKIVEIEVIFEPRVTIAQSIELVSITNPDLSGVYKVIEINHSGMISPQVGGAVTTKLKLFNGAPFKVVS
jgi:hypothetical protein